MNVGDELPLGKGHYVKAFRTCHVIPSQGYLVYSRRHKLKPEFLGLPGKEIKKLKDSGVQVTDQLDVPEVAFTGDTTPQFILDPDNEDVLRARLLIMEVTFIDDSVTPEHAQTFGHTHLAEVIPLASHLKNEAILFIHFSARYSRQDILAAMDKLPPTLKDRVTPLLERF
eukprot:TRINITY_DN6918_c0_g1_i3.p1 TRINITY_DN6918_c0_g1~~TRINITY_DN6918_c0_g1_i3.p1  ORF type:complete len:193 (-),score=47.59 TRINITY_DN6918_c0_g1_i3:211-720(-)